MGSKGLRPFAGAGGARIALAYFGRTAGGQLFRILALVPALLASLPALADPAPLRDGEVLRGRFVQERHLKGFERPVRSEGNFVVVPGRGLIWRAEAPFAVTTVVTPSGLVQRVGAAETMRLPARRLPMLSRLYHMLGGAMAGDWGALEGDFMVTRAPGGRATLIPRRPDPDQPIAAIRATVSRFVDEVDIEKAGGDHDHLVFSAQTLTRGVPAPDEAALLEAAR